MGLLCGHGVDEGSFCYTRILQARTGNRLGPANLEQ